MSLRLIPRFTVFRPADANETAAAWKLALERRGPSAFALTRQDLPILADQGRVAEGVRRGGYVLSEAPSGTPAVVLLATGSEVALALDAQKALEERGVEARVVSMPSWEVWREQPAEFRREVLPAAAPVLVIEAGATAGWREIIGDNGVVIGLDRFGESAPGPVVMDRLGFNVENVVAHAERLAAEGAPAARAGNDG